jgi:tetratricopeptide (TPR) repeat protein
MWLVNLLLPMAAQDREEAIELNDRGFALYEAERYVEALEMFEASWRADDSYLYAHYNYACTLGILVREEPELWFGKRDAAFEHLERTLGIRPAYREKMLSDPDLSELRKEFRFYAILGYDTRDRQDAVYLLLNLSWYGAPAAGVSPYTCGVDFYSDGSLQFWFFTPARFPDPQGGELYRVNGSYRVLAGGELEIQLAAAMNRRRSLDDIRAGTQEKEPRTRFGGRLEAGGELRIDLFEFPFLSVYERF